MIKYVTSTIVMVWSPLSLKADGHIPVHHINLLLQSIHNACHFDERHAACKGHIRAQAWSSDKGPVGSLQLATSVPIL